MFSSQFCSAVSFEPWSS